MVVCSESTDGSLALWQASPSLTLVSSSLRKKPGRIEGGWCFVGRSRELLSLGVSAGHCRNEDSGDVELVWDESTGGGAKRLRWKGHLCQVRTGSGGVESPDGNCP